MNGVRRLFTNNSGSTTTATTTTTTTQTTVESSVAKADGSSAWAPIIIGRQASERPVRDSEQAGSTPSGSLKEPAEQQFNPSIFMMRPTESPDPMSSSEAPDSTINLRSGLGSNGIINQKQSSHRPHHDLILELLASESAIECKDYQKLEPDEMTTLKKVRR
jgi:hypothetical protein